MTATLVVTPTNLGASMPVARVTCADCGAALHFDVDTPKLRRLVERLSEVHVCATLTIPCGQGCCPDYVMPL